MDVHDKKTRSYNMSQIKGKNTKPEELVRKYLFFKASATEKMIKGCQALRILSYLNIKLCFLLTVVSSMVMKGVNTLYGPKVMKNSGKIKLKQISLVIKRKLKF